MATRFYKGTNPLLNQPKYGNQLLGRMYLGGARVYGAEPQPTGFDPTLGGTLTVNHWWDFTDSSTMVLSGTNVTSISDKQGSYDVTTAWNSGPEFVDAATGTTFNNSGLSSTTTPPSTLAAGNGNTPDLTWVVIFKPNSSATVLNRVVGINTNGSYGLNDYQPSAFHNSVNVWSPTQNTNNGGSGGAYFMTHDWDGADYASGYQGITLTNEHFWSTRTYWSGTTNTLDVSYNGLGYGGAKSDVYGNAGVRDEFVFGARDISGGYQNPFYGDMKHVIVYNGKLTDANISDLYTAWSSL